MAERNLDFDKVIDRKNTDCLKYDFAQKRGMLISGGEPDVERAAATLLDEFRGGKIGRITLDDVPNEGTE